MEAKMIEGTRKYLKWLFENGWKCYWHFAFWCRNNNFRKNVNNIFQSDGDMNIIAIPEKAKQPKDLLEITNPKEEWDQNKYKQFYEANGLDLN